MRVIVLLKGNKGVPQPKFDPMREPTFEIFCRIKYLKTVTLF